jgi:hypothetical protein
MLKNWNILGNLVLRKVVYSLWFGVFGLLFGVWSLEFGIWDLGFEILNFEF